MIIEVTNLKWIRLGGDRALVSVGSAAPTYFEEDWFNTLLIFIKNYFYFNVLDYNFIPWTNLK